MREKVGEQNQVVIIDLNDPENVMRRPITADSAIMNPDSKVIALKASKQVQVFDLEKKAKLKSFLMSEDVVFWHWLGPATIGMVTDNTVFHWDVEHGGDPQRIFDRHVNLAGCQIIGYRTDSTGRWLLLVGISAQQGRVVGAMQLFNVDRGVSQIIEGHAGAFAEITMDGSSCPTKLFVFAVRTASSAKVHMVEIDHREGAPVYSKKAVDLTFPPEAASDFPVSMQIDNKHDLVYVITKFGFIQIFDLHTGICVFANRISSETVFVTAEWRASAGIIGINRKGQVLSVAIDESNIISYCMQSLGNAELALRIASKSNLPGAEELFITRFQQLVASGAFVEAAKLAARSPNGILRTPETIERLKAVAVSPGQSSPLLQYFSVLLDSGSLNAHESLELARPVLAQGKKALLEKWLKEDKIACSEALGDNVRQVDSTLALSIYLRADVPSKVCLCFAELGQFSKLVLFAKKVGFAPEYDTLLQAAMASDPAKAVEFGQLLLADESLGVDPNEIFDLFVSHELLQQATSCVLERLKRNTDDVAGLQTKVLRLNIQQAPTVADAILRAKMLTKYDRQEIAGLCESKGLYQRALEHYTSASDISRILLGADDIDVDWMATYFKALGNTEEIVAVLRTLMAQDAGRYVQLVITTGVKLADRVAPSFIMEIFESMGNDEGMFIFTGALLPTSSDPSVHFAYIKAATRTGRYRDVERVCKESSRYDAGAVWTFLTSEEDLPDPLPLIVVADRFNLVHELVLHLYQKGLLKHIEVYVQKVNPTRLPEVVAALLDCGCDGNTIQVLIDSVPPRFSLDALVKVLVDKEQLPVLMPLLERKIKSENSRDPAIYNALAKIYVMKRQLAEAATFLRENNLYDTKAIGLFCQAREPQLALIAFEKGRHDKELLDMTNAQSLFKEQAQYLLRRRDANLWRSVLLKSNAHRSSLLGALVNGAVNDSSDAEEVSIAVKALMAAELSTELASVLEKIVFGSASFAQNRNLQNLLLLTCIKTSPAKVMNHMQRLKNYDGAEIARTCAQAGLYEEAFFAYKKAGNMSAAMSMLVEHIRDWDRSQGFAEDCNDKEVWKVLGKGLLKGGKIVPAIEAYIRADDCSDYVDLIKAAGGSPQHAEDLLRYLQMARRKSRDPLVDNEIIFVLATLHRLADLEDFLARPHAAQLQIVADRCFQAQIWEAAKLLYASVSNHAKLATTLVHLRDFQGAVESAKRANSLRTWADVHAACLETNEYSLAQVCGLHLIVHQDELEPLVYAYESRGLYSQCLTLLEGSLGLERAPTSLYTELAIQYARHAPEKLSDLLQRYSSANRLNVPKIAGACAEAHLWPEMASLLTAAGEHEKALNVMFEHPSAWSHERMCTALVHVATPDTVLRALRFYLDETAPNQVNDLLTRVGTRIDPTRIVELLRQRNLLFLAKGYLKAVQPLHSAMVNAAINELLLAEEDLEALKTSLAVSDKYDAAALAGKLAAHPKLEFRRLAAQIYRSHRLWREALGLLLAEGLHKDAIILAAESKERAVSEDLLRHLASTRQAVLFLGACYACADTLPPDVIVECAWRNEWMDISIPVLCQSLRDAAPESMALPGSGSRTGSRLNFAPY